MSSSACLLGLERELVLDALLDRQRLRLAALVGRHQLGHALVELLHLHALALALSVQLLLEPRVVALHLVERLVELLLRRQQVLVVARQLLHLVLQCDGALLQRE